MKYTGIFLIILTAVFSFSCLSIPPAEPDPDPPEIETAVDDIPAADNLETDIGENDSAVHPEKPEIDTSAAATAVEPESPTQELQTAEVPPLSTAAFRSTISEMMPWNMTAVKDGHFPLTIIHDLDKNGYEDALVVAVEGDESDDVSLSDLSESARLFQSDKEYSNFLLLIFYQYSGEVVLRYTVPVSRQLVFNGVEPFEIRKGSDFPYALLFSFRTRSGIEQELIILNGRGITRFTIMENLSEITLIEDIDEDGFQDIIVHEQGFEEGTGFETFLTWNKWNLREYTEYRTTNIVRNLREFYLVCAEYLRAGETAEFLEYALEPDVVSDLKNRGATDNEIMKMIFKSADGSGFEDDFFSIGGFSAVVFPEIMETPFSYANRNDFRHGVSVRFGRPGGESRICLAELKMKKNPFQNKQFCFTIKE